MSEETETTGEAGTPEEAGTTGAAGTPEAAPTGKPPSYEVAVERLETIIDRLDSGQAGLRETLDLCSEGRELITYCAGELEAVGEGLRELRLDELAARLETGPADGAEA